MYRMTAAIPSRCKSFFCLAMEDIPRTVVTTTLYVLRLPVAEILLIHHFRCNLHMELYGVDMDYTAA
jgi:hypothetical protein